MLNKRFNLIVIFILIGVFFLTGCSSNNHSNNNSDVSNKYTLVVNVEGEGKVIEQEVITTKDYENGTEVELTAVPTNEDYLFSHWEGDYNSNKNTIEIVMDQNIIITAVFQATVLLGSQPYEITNWYQLNEVRNNLDSDFILMNNIDNNSLGYLEFVGNQTRTAKGWVPIGDDTSGFNGIFNGNTKAINDLYIKRNNEDYIGLFGSNGGSIENLKLEAINIIGNDGVGGLVGFNVGNIDNCNVSGNIVGNELVGGIVGYNDTGVINNCYVTGNISGVSIVGGLAGYFYSPEEITNCYSKADVNGENDYIGGLIGHNRSINLADNYVTGEVSGNKHVGGLIGYNEMGEINDCYVIGDTYGDNMVGGLVGLNKSSDEIKGCYVEADVIGEDNYIGGLIGSNKDNSKINNCYVSGTVEGLNYVGGLIGENKEGKINKSYALGDISGNNYIGGLIGFNDSYTEVLTSFVKADVTGENNYIGGLIGYNFGLRIINNYAIGDIRGIEYVGGLIGYTYNLQPDSINKTYSVGDVIGLNNYGGLIGYNEDIFYYNINSSYWDTEVGLGISHSAGGEGKNTNEMTQKETFIGWDFNEVWDIKKGDTYPYLKWQKDNITFITND